MLVYKQVIKFSLIQTGFIELVFFALWKINIDRRKFLQKIIWMFLLLVSLSVHIFEEVQLLFSV